VPRDGISCIVKALSALSVRLRESLHRPNSMKILERQNDVLAFPGNSLAECGAFKKDAWLAAMRNSGAQSFYAQDRPLIRRSPIAKGENRI